MRTLLLLAGSTLRVLSDNAVGGSPAAVRVRSHAPLSASGVRRVSVARYVVAVQSAATFASGLIAGGARCLECLVRLAGSCTFGLANSVTPGGRRGHPDHHRQVGTAA